MVPRLGEIMTTEREISVGVKILYTAGVLFLITASKFIDVFIFIKRKLK